MGRKSQLKMTEMNEENRIGRANMRVKEVKKKEEQRSAAITSYLLARAIAKAKALEQARWTPAPEP